MTARARIVKLDPETVSRISAGEVIQRPFNVVKELLENALDAGASKVEVELRGGGQKLIQPHDLPLACMRWATSKLAAFEDLASLHSMGFRGEALASISVVSRVTITTRCRGDPGHVARYRGGTMLGPPTCCGDGVPPGTTVRAEDLFYNLPLRRRALNAATEHARILDFISRFALHHHAMGIEVVDEGPAPRSVHSGAARKNLFLPACASRLDRLAQVSGRCVQWLRDAAPLEIDRALEQAEHLEALISVAWGARHRQLVASLADLIVVNDRIVEWTQLRRAVRAQVELWAGVPETRAWIYIALRVDPAALDVNVHPTKARINVLGQDRLVERVAEAINEALRQNASRGIKDASQSPLAIGSQLKTTFQGSLPPRRVTRMDPAAIKLQAFMKQDDPGPALRREPPATQAPPPAVDLLLRSPAESIPAGQIGFVGCVSHELVFFQKDTTLYLGNLQPVIRDVLRSGFGRGAPHLQASVVLEGDRRHHPHIARHRSGLEADFGVVFDDGGQRLMQIPDPLAVWALYAEDMRPARLARFVAALEDGLAPCTIEGGGRCEDPACASRTIAALTALFEPSEADDLETVARLVETGFLPAAKKTQPGSRVEGMPVTCVEWLFRVFERC